MSAPFIPTEVVIPENVTYAPRELSTLTLDLGTQTGWVLMRGDRILQSGTIRLASEVELRQQRRDGKERTGDLRFQRLQEFLARFIVEQEIQRVVFEDVLFVRSQMQAQLWASLRATIWSLARLRPGLEIHCVPSSTLKRFATGQGLATKQNMATALVAAMAGLELVGTGEAVLIRKTDGLLADDNEIDALWVARYTQAVDRGELDFLGPQQRKSAARLVRRQKRAEKRAQTKARKQAALQVERERKTATKLAIKLAGRCCGVYRVADGSRRAVCRKCGKDIRLTLAA